jgi:hypothetical protein
LVRPRHRVAVGPQELAARRGGDLGHVADEPLEDAAADEPGVGARVVVLPRALFTSARGGAGPANVQRDNVRTREKKREREAKRK